MDHSSQTSRVSDLKKHFSSTSCRDEVSGISKKTLKSSIKSPFNSSQDFGYSKNSVKFDLQNTRDGHSNFQKNVTTGCRPDLNGRSWSTLKPTSENINRRCEFPTSEFFTQKWINGSRDKAQMFYRKESDIEGLETGVCEELTSFDSSTHSSGTPTCNKQSNYPIQASHRGNKNTFKMTSKNNLQTAASNNCRQSDSVLENKAMNCSVAKNTHLGTNRFGGNAQGQMLTHAREGIMRSTNHCIMHSQIDSELSSASITTSTDSGILPDSYSPKESGSEMSNQESIISCDSFEKPEISKRAILGGAISITGSKNCLAFEVRNNNKDLSFPRKTVSNISIINLESDETQFSNQLSATNARKNYDYRNLHRNESENSLGTYHRQYHQKYPINRQRVESIKRHNVQQTCQRRQRRHNHHRKTGNVTRISVGSESIDDVYFSEPEYLDEDDDNDDDTIFHDKQRLGFNGYRQPAENSKSLISSKFNETICQNCLQNFFPYETVTDNLMPTATGFKSQPVGARISERRHTCEVDFSEDNNLRFRNIPGKSDNIQHDHQSQSNSVKRSLSETSFDVNIRNAARLTNDYGISMTVKLSEDDVRNSFQQDKQVLCGPAACKDQTNFERLKNALNYQDNKAVKNFEEPVNRTETVPDQLENVKNSEKGINQKEAKPQRKESIFKKLFMSSFSMSRKGFREKWVQKRERKATETQDVKANMKASNNQSSTNNNFLVPGQKPINKFNSNATVGGNNLNKKTFFPHRDNLHATASTGEDNILDDVGETWLDQFEGQQQQPSMYQMWDTSESLKPKASNEFRSDRQRAPLKADWIEAVDVKLLLKGARQNSITESLEILRRGNCSGDTTPRVFLRGREGGGGGTLNIVLHEDVDGENKKHHRIKREIVVDMQANSARRDFYEYLVRRKIEETNGSDSCVFNEESICELDCLTPDENIELLSKFITLSRMNKFVGGKKNLKKSTD